MGTNREKIKLLIITQKVDINDDILGFFHGWIEKFAGKFEKIIVICLQEGDYDLPRNVKVLSLGKERGKSKIKYLINFYRFIYRERKNHDTVFVHMNPIYVILGGLFWKLRHKKISLWYAHGYADWRLKLAERIANIIFTSTKEGFRIKSKKLKIVGQGIDTKKFKPIAKKENRVFKIISVGRISPSKDYETLIKAIEDLKDINFEVEIIGGVGLPGDESYSERIKELVKKEELKRAIKFLGPLPFKKIASHLQSADLFVSMGLTGSLDKVLLEAMACGLPILTCNEALENVLGKYRKVLMYPKKDFKFLAKKIDFIFKLKDGERKAIGQDLRQIVVRDHSLNNLIKKISYTLIH